MKASFLMFLLVCGVIPAYALTSWAGSEQRVLTILQNEFGAPIQNSPLLYNVNKNYVLEINQTGDTVTIFKVYPKHYLDDMFPEWAKTERRVELTLREYSRILSRIGSVENIGSLISEDKIGVVSNQTLWLVDRYQRAYVEKGLYRTFYDAQHLRTTVRSFNVYRIHRVVGVVEEKTLSPRGNSKPSKIKVSGQWYFAEEAVAKKLRIGQIMRGSLAGPVN